MSSSKERGEEGGERESNEGSRRVKGYNVSGSAPNNQNRAELGISTQFEPIQTSSTPLWNPYLESSWFLPDQYNMIQIGQFRLVEQTLE